MASGRNIPVLVQRAVLARDGMVCVYCSVSVVRSTQHRPDRLHFDHVEPWASGGLHTVTNLVVACARCNLSRPKPRVITRADDEPNRPWSVGRSGLPVEYRTGGYWWSEGFVPPVEIDDLKVAILLAEHVRDTRRPLSWTVHAVARGALPATREGRIYVQPELSPEPPVWARHRMRRLAL